MAVFSPAERGAGWSLVVTGGDVTFTTTGMSTVTHRSEPSGSGETVEAGAGTGREQASPEQGMRRAGAGCSSGDLTESPATVAGDPATTSTSSRVRFKKGSDCVVTRWLQAAQAVEGADKPWTRRSRNAPVPNRASRLNRVDLIRPLSPSEQIHAGGNQPRNWYT
jgi:hypothetical protein